MCWRLFWPRAVFLRASGHGMPPMPVQSLRSSRLSRVFTTHMNAPRRVGRTLCEAFAEEERRKEQVSNEYEDVMRRFDWWLATVAPRPAQPQPRHVRACQRHNDWMACKRRAQPDFVVVTSVFRRSFLLNAERTLYPFASIFSVPPSCRSTKTVTNSTVPPACSTAWIACKVESPRVITSSITTT